jgi:hypothetical protein
LKRLSSERERRARQERREIKGKKRKKRKEETYSVWELEKETEALID